MEAEAIITGALVAAADEEFYLSAKGWKISFVEFWDGPDRAGSLRVWQSNLVQKIIHSLALFASGCSPAPSSEVGAE